MATVNPNELSAADYWARVNGQPAPAAPMMIPPELRYQPQSTGGLAAISGGQTNWNSAAPTWFQTMAAGIPVQQNGYDATAAVPVASGPAWAGASPVPAYPQSGANMTMPGSRAGWEEWGIPPIVMQSNPYATAAYRTYTNPYGQIGVQPLIGFPSAYPHVLSGVPGSLYRHVGEFAQALPYTPLMQMMAMGQFPPMQARATTQPKARGIGGGGDGTTTGRKNTAQPVAPAQPQPVPGRYDETRWRNGVMPVPSAPPVMPVMTQLPPELGGDVNTSPEAHAAGHGVTYPGEFRVLPNGQMVPYDYIPPTSFTPNLLTPEEAAETADGMYIDPNKTLMQNLLEGAGAVSMPLTLGAGAAFQPATRIVGGAVVPEAAGTLPYAARALP